eukprot:CAMPEP_0194560066 /NCGR_PEP_ID=MMETSP0292-20121207/1383_1 /TAXON_ID=39354 /ORGANISM="Heterosigma akashiwo, Strain CCMP2393" /LENGTH=60 /DNA_ID=CAMNT_0039408147 /DNA_START=851 /DNA_END=1029 /DNA_ORIENTATION=-
MFNEVQAFFLQINFGTTELVEEELPGGQVPAGDVLGQPLQARGLKVVRDPRPAERVAEAR